ncbi:MAG TPA: flavodoxin family protein [Clostridiales bacterium]|nr:flavodoxin family protein [Clostridiales bacterium]
MKVLLINGSCHKNGCTFTALTEIETTLKSEGIEAEIIQIGSEAIKDCTACGKCRTLDNKCVFGDDDMVNEILAKAAKADGFVFGTPVYYAHPSGRILSLLNRLFYAGGKSFAYKPGAAVASARRAGTTASIDVLNKYFTICNMPVVSSQYWNMVHGNRAEEAKQDEEGMQTMRALGANMAWLLKCIEAGKAKGIVPSHREQRIMTNFIR